MRQLHENTKARRQALQLLYTEELMERDEAENSGTSDAVLVISQCPDDVDEAELVGEQTLSYAGELAAGVRDQILQIDAWIGAVAQNWTLARMPLVDRNIIRIAVYEVVYCDEIPMGVAINEAVEMAKVFGGDESPKFVNGVLGRIAALVESDGLAEIEPLDEASGRSEDEEAEAVEGAAPDEAVAEAGADEALEEGDVEASVDAAPENGEAEADADQTLEEAEAGADASSSWAYDLFLEGE